MSSERGVGKYLRAVVYILGGETEEQAQRRCVTACERRKRKIVGLIVDRTNGNNWADAVMMCLQGEADIIVVEDRENLPLDRVGRVESAVEPAPTETVTANQRRPRTVRRTRN